MAYFDTRVPAANRWSSTKKRPAQHGALHRPGRVGAGRKASTTPSSDTAALDRIYGPARDGLPPELPEIPLWYNGAWFQGNDTYWTGFPSSTNPNDQNTPVMWGSYLEP